MSMTMRPFQEFSNPGHLIVLWLNNDGVSRMDVSHASCNIWNACLIRWCTDGAANMLRELCQSSRTKPPHVISGDMDSIFPETIDYFTPTSKIEQTPDQDHSDLTKALDLISETEAVANGEAKAILILGGLNGRFDHTLGTLNSIYSFIIKKRLPVYAIDATNLVTILPMGSTELYVDKRRLTGKSGLFPLCQRETRVTTEGFKWNLDDQCMEYGGLVSSCNEIESDCLLVKTSAPVVFTCELQTQESFFG